MILTNAGSSDDNTKQQGDNNTEIDTGTIKIQSDSILVRVISTSRISGDFKISFPFLIDNIETILQCSFTPYLVFHPIFVSLLYTLMFFFLTIRPLDFPRRQT